MISGFFFLSLARVVWDDGLRSSVMVGFTRTTLLVLASTTGSKSTTLARLAMTGWAGEKGTAVP